MSPEQRARALRLADEIEPTTHHPIIYLEKLRSAADLLRELATDGVPLTDQQINSIDKVLQHVDFWRVVEFTRAVERAHGIVGGGK